jgi:hypothetical protein
LAKANCFICILLNGLKPNPIEFSWIRDDYLFLFGAQIGRIAEEKGSFYHFINVSKGFIIFNFLSTI